MRRRKLTGFAHSLGELFPGSPVTTLFASGIEKMVRIETSTGKKRGYVDSYYGNAVIEFEKSLNATQQDAERQLREYVSGIWSDAKVPPPLIAIASDGIIWNIYLPYIIPGTTGGLKPQDIELKLFRRISLSARTLDDFWLWLTSLLFRDTQIKPTAEQFRLDFGVTSPAFRDGIRVLSDAWVAVRGFSEPRLAFPGSNRQAVDRLDEKTQMKRKWDANDAADEVEEPPQLVEKTGEPPGNRTPNLLIKSQLLCLLS